MEEEHVLGRLGHLRLRHLELLDHVLELGSLSRVAQKVCLTQPAVTSMLKELESAAGAQLVVRGRQGASLTRKGELLLERFRQARQALEGTASFLGEAPARPHLRVGTVQQAMLFLMPHAYARMRAAGLDLTLSLQELSVPECLRGVLDGSLDCAITRVDSNYLSVDELSRIQIFPLKKVPLNVVCGPNHPIARRNNVDIAMLAEAEWVVHPRGTQVREAFEQAFFQAGLIPPRPAIDSVSFYSNFHLIAASDLLSIAPATAVARYAALKLIKEVKYQWPVELSPLNFVSIRRKASRELESLLEACQTVCSA